MAEIGVIASGMGVASLAIQVADSLLKLKGFLDNVKEAPDEIKYLIEEIDTLGTLLSEFDADIPNGESEVDSSSMRKCWEHCSRGLGILEAIVRELDMDIGRRRRIGSLKAALKTGSIKRLKDRLKSAQIMLLMAHQIYSAAIQKQNSVFNRQWAEVQQEQLDKLRAGVSQTTKVMVSIQETITSSHSTSRISEVDAGYDEQNEASTVLSLLPNERSAKRYRRIGQVAKSKQHFSFQLKAPFWLEITNRALEVSAQRAPFGWEFTFEMYNIVEHDAPIMKYSQAGNITAIQDLFTKQKASPNDRTWWGQTVLGRAAFFGQLEVCRLLRQQGADGYCQISDKFGKVLAVGRVLAGMYQMKGAQHQLELARLLGEGVDLEGKSLNQSQSFRGDSALLSWLISETQSDYYQRDLRSRVCIATDICTLSGQPYVESLIRGLLGSCAIDFTVCGISDHRGRTLLHSALWHLGEQYHTSSEEYNSLASENSKGSYCRSPHGSQSSVLKSLLDFVSELVVADSDLHGCALRWELQKSLETPLIAIFTGFASANYVYSQPLWINPYPLVQEGYTPETDPEKVLVVVLLWLRVLARAGIDLEEYGQKEKLVYQKGLAENFYRFKLADIEKWDSGIDEPISTIYSITFIYGPTPTDWKFWLIEQMNDSFLEFWDMVDHPERAMPGYWDERFDETDD